MPVMRCLPATIQALFAGLFLTPLPLEAGPWARPEGEAFLSFSITADGDPNMVMTGLEDPSFFGSLYGELGLGHRMTLGADLGRGDHSDQAVVFLRYTLTDPGATWQVAVDGGLGFRDEGSRPDRPLVRLGASVGRGFGGLDAPRWWLPIAHEGGWATLDACGLYDIHTGEVILQAEATLGVSLSDRLRLMLQLKAEDWPDADFAASIAPSAVWNLTDRTATQLGVRMGFAGDPTLGLQIGLWQSF